MVEPIVEQQRSYKFLRLRWQENHFALYSKYANLICITLMMLTIPTDFLSFPGAEAWNVVRVRFLAICLFLGNLLAAELIKRRGASPLAYMILLTETVAAINFLYLYFLLTMDPQYRLAVTTGCLTAIFGAHLFLYRFHTSHLAFTILYAIAVAVPFSMTAEWRSYLISVLLGHFTGFVLTLFFRRVFYGTLEKDYLIKLQSDAIRKQSEEIENALKDKDNLLKILIHDIANPLVVIMGDESSLTQKNPQFDDDTKKRLGRIHNACTAINHLIKHVREFEAVRSGKRAVKLEPCSINECLDGAFLMVEAKAKAKGVAMKVQEGLQDDLYCMADGVNLTHQVLVNILSNAIKFSDKGSSVDIHVRSVGGMVQISIRDHGVGMPKGVLDNLFSSTRPTSRPGTAGEKGTGFGMPLAKAYMDRFNGQIQVETATVEEGTGKHGTTFILTLPQVL